MEPKTVVKVENVFKSFKIPHDKSYSLKSAAINLFKKKSYSQYSAANGISFEVREGEFLGIIGRNGCGKSTMLKMLAGIYLPNKGKITVNGRLSPFLELGVGFNPELTAHDNVFLNGTLLGLTRKEINEKYDEIIKFAELEEFVDQRLKNFSSGMQVRLAFSVAIQAHADILLIDEVLAVGDANFRRKCEKVFFDLKEKGKTIVFVTHSMGEVNKYCDRVLLIEEGKIIKQGIPEMVTGYYDKININKNYVEKNFAKDNEFGDKKAEVTKIEFIKNNKKSDPVFDKEESFGLRFTIKNNTKKRLPVNLAVGIYNNGQKCFVIDTATSDNSFSLNPTETKKAELQIIKNCLLAGEYSLNFNISPKDQSNPYYAVVRGSEFLITGDKEALPLGVVNLDYKWELL